MRFKVLAFYLIFFILLKIAVVFGMSNFFDFPGIKIKQKEIYIQNYIPKDKVDYLILGDSAILYQFKPAILGPESFSAAQIAAPFYLSKKYFDQLNIKQINKGIILGVTFIDNHYDKDLWTIGSHANFLTMHEIESMLCDDDQCSLFERMKIALKYFQSKYFFDDDVWSTLSYGIKGQKLIYLNHFRNHMLSNFVRNKGGYSSPSDWAKPDSRFYDTYRESFSSAIRPPPSELKLLKKFVEELNIKGIRVFLVLPYYYKKNANLDFSSYEKSYDQLISTIQSPNFFIINTRKKQFELDKKYFVDFNHLNKEGAIIFTKKIRDEIENMDLSLSFGKGDRQ